MDEGNHKWIKNIWFYSFIYLNCSQWRYTQIRNVICLVTKAVLVCNVFSLVCETEAAKAIS